jgi:hypothetical protein
MITKLFLKYEWLVNTLIKTGGLTLKEINERYKANVDLSGGLEVPPTTFHRWRDDILDAFAVIIECDRRTKRYYVSNRKELNFEAMKLWMFQVMEFGNYLVSHVGLHKRIIMEPFSFDTDVMDRVVKAMLHFKIIDFVYEEMKDQQVVAPYYIKVNHQKAYLVGRLGNDDFQWYDLEKIREVHIMDKSFEMDDDQEILGRKQLTLVK